MSSIRYRASIEGLRAIAVLSVLIYHLHRAALPGGFVGVDVFFVISGYLITSGLYAECAAGTFRFARFYQRRVARIFPVLLLVVVATLLGAALLYNARDLAETGKLASSSVLSIVNLSLVRYGGYFEVSNDALPFLHCWSLSLEEQFYLLLPLAIWGAVRLRWTRRRLLLVIGTLAALSFAGSIWLTAIKPNWAFYLLPPRGWELLAGSMLGIATVPSPEQRVPRAGLGFVGLLMVVLAVFLVPEGAHFPGYVAALPVLGALLVIASPGSFSESLLSRSLLTAVGKRSYSLYLWHWPIYCFVDYALYTHSAWLRVPLKVALTGVVSTASFAFCERPLRRFFNGEGRARMSFGFAAIGAMALAAIGQTIYVSNFANPSLRDIAKGGIVFNSKVSHPSIALLGDSNASVYGHAMKRLAQEHHARANVLCVAGGDPFAPAELHREELHWLAGARPNVVIVAAEWSDKIGEDHEKLRAFLDEMLASAREVILITQPPALPADGTREAIRRDGPHSFLEREEHAARRRAANEYLHSLAAGHVHVLDVESIFLAPDGSLPFADANGHQLYQDRGHLSGRGAELVVRRLDQELGALLDRAGDAGP